MNPFTDSTVARPLDEAEKIWTAEPAGPDANSKDTMDTQAIASSPAVKNIPPGPAKPFFLSRASREARRQRRSQFVALALSLAAPGFAMAINVNSATAEQLQAVRGIGPKTAQIIVDERQRAGPFVSFDDLSERVKGIGPKKAAAMQASGLKVEGAAVTGKSPAK